VTEPKSESDPKVKKYDSEDWLEKINAKLADLNVSDFKDLEEKKEEAEKNAKQLYEKFEKLSVTEQRKEAKNLEKARDAYKRALAALEFARLNSETEEIETDDIAKGKVEAKQISSMSSHALVRIGREKAAVYRIVPKKSVDQTQWDGADEFKDLRPLKLSPAEANDILGVAFRGDADSFTAAFNIRHELRPVKSKPSDPTSRPTRPRMWIYGKRENGRFWLLPRTSWANIASRSADKATDIALGIAERQLKRFLLDLETGRSVDLDDIGEDKRPLREQTVGMDDHTKRDVSPPRTLDSIEHSPEPEGNKASETVLPSTET
jgi:hypothetical protein